MFTIPSRSGLSHWRSPRHVSIFQSLRAQLRMISIVHLLQILGAITGLGLALWGAVSGLRRAHRGEDEEQPPPVIEASYPDPSDVP